MSTSSQMEREAGTPFQTGSEAWFWAIACLRARRDGERGRSAAGVQRPCDPDDVVRCLDRLYLARRVDLRHARVLSRWGERQSAPDPNLKSSDEPRLWYEAMETLETSLRSKGIVAGPSNRAKGMIRATRVEEKIP